MKKNIFNNVPPLWKVYWLLVLVTVIISLLLARIFYNEVLTDKFKSLKHINALAHADVESRLFTREAVIKILSHRLVEIDAQNNLKDAQHILDDIKKSSPNLLGFALARNDGQLLAVSGIDRKKLPNILDNNATHNTFKQTLSSNNIVIGHTYYMELFDKWVLPLRYSIKNDYDDSELVTIVWYDAESTNALFSHKSIPQDTTLTIIKDDFYIVDYKVTYPRNTEYYLYPFPDAVVEQFNLKELKSTGFIQKAYTDRDMSKRYIAVSYSHKYKLYISATIAHADAVNGYKQKAVFLALGTLLLIIILYLFFSYIRKKDIQTNKTLEHRACHDDLTSLKNRFAITKSLQFFIQDNKIFSLAFIDLDSFKKINDLYGHEFGDNVLKMISKRVISILDKDMLFARFSGDEFALLIPGNSKRAEITCQKILDAIRQPIDFEYNYIKLGASIGVVVYPEDAKDVKTLMSYADLALRKAKKYRNSFEFFDQDFHKVVQRKSTIEELFNSSLENEEFFLLYQPQVEAKTHKIVGIEALVRWKNERLGDIFPDEFISIAEESGFIIPLGKHILKRACTDTLKAWDESGTRFKLSVNVSVRQLVENDFIREVNKIINETNFPHNMLIIEVTESLMIEDIDMIVQKLQLLRDLGFGISLDDFGTGFSSLSMINKLPISELKIDRSFIRDILVDKDDALLTEMIVTIGKHLDVEIIAEGVEEKEHVKILEEFGCDTLQGYYFSRPATIKDLLEFIKKSS